jgi:23S rRNA-/tRNA-specific pseudouridylate synthase
MDSTTYLGFPAPLLGMKPARLPVLFDDGDLLALAKPVGVLVQEDAWFRKVPVLVEAIRHQSLSGKPEFERLGISREGLWAITDLDPECHGPVLFSRQRPRAEALRNALGSGNLEFTFCILSKGEVEEDSFDCDLPITRHREKPRMLVSHTTGKIAHTRFQKIGVEGAYQSWIAQTNYPRRHQIPLHAMESGLPILGDERYAKSWLPMLSRLKRDYQPKRDLEEKPLYDGPAYYLKTLKLDDGTVIECSSPPKWRGLCRQLEKYPQG